MGKQLELRYTPFPHPVKGLTGAGFAKMVCKILSPKGLEVKILTTKDLGRYLLFLHITASALTMICSLNSVVKVGCHIGDEENAGRSP